MLKSVQAEFPYPGSLALYEDHLWRVHRHNGDGTATIYRDDCPSASGHRTVDIADLTDPSARIARRADAPLAVRLALALRDTDAVHLSDAIDQAQIITADYRLSIPVTAARICAILRDLGWRETRQYGSRGPIIFLRGETTLADIATRKRRRAA